MPRSRDRRVVCPVLLDGRRFARRVVIQISVGSILGHAATTALFPNQHVPELVGIVHTSGQTHRHANDGNVFEQGVGMVVWSYNLTEDCGTQGSVSLLVPDRIHSFEQHVDLERLGKQRDEPEHLDEQTSMLFRNHGLV